MCDETVSAGPELVVGSPERDIYVQPIAKVEKKNLSVLEDDEEEIFKMRSKLYRYSVDDEDGGLWKERGVGDVRILKHKTQNSYRLVMRRDKTLKLCANHQLLPNMLLQNHMGNEKAFVWSTPSDCSEDLSGRAETLCIRFGKVEGAADFKAAFEKSVHGLGQSSHGQSTADSEKLVTGLSTLKVCDEKESKHKSILGDAKKDITVTNVPHSVAKPSSNSGEETRPSDSCTNFNESSSK